MFILPARYRSRRTIQSLVFFALIIFFAAILPTHNVSIVHISNNALSSSNSKAQSPSSSPSSSRSKRFRFRVPQLFRSSKAYEDLDWGDGDTGTYAVNYAKSKSSSSKPKARRWKWAPQWRSSSDDSASTESTSSFSTPDPESVLNQILKEHGPLIRNQQHELRDNGLLVTNPNASHPIYHLIQRASKQWKEKLHKASKSLDEAVAEYRRRYQRPPPKGFDKWWDYVKEHDVQLPDEYDQIFRDLEPFYGMQPSYIHDAQQAWAKQEGTYTLKCVDGYVFLANHTMPFGQESIAEERANAQIELLRDVQQYLPDFTATFTAHDVPYQFIAHDIVQDAKDASAMGEYLDVGQDFDRDYIGWASACPANSPLRRQNPSDGVDIDKLWEQPKTFIYDHKRAMDPCEHPTHVHLTGFLEAHNSGKGPGPAIFMVPAFSMCTTTLHSDILTVAPEQWTEDLGEDPPWDQKQDERLLWRGSSTGMYFTKDNKWNWSQRVRLVDTANERKGSSKVLRTTGKPSDPASDVNVTSRDKISEHYMDVGFAGRPLQCEGEVCRVLKSEHVFKRGQNWQEAWKYKYIMDIDGNGWSGRFKRLMTSNSLILKSTIFPEWFTDRVQPWYHYAPIKNDLTDLFDVLTFFRGDLDGRGGHDALAEIIASEGKKWSKSFWRKEDMVAYQFRLFLEYSRVISSDRDSMSYNPQAVHASPNVAYEDDD